MVEDNGSVSYSEFEFIPPREYLDVALNKAVSDALKCHGKRLLGWNIHYYPPAPFGYAAMIEWLLCDERGADASS